MATVKIFLFLLHLSQYKSEVFWTAFTQPVVFGESLELLCNITRSDCSGCTQHWYGGSQNSLISFNEKTVDSEKYVVTKKRTDGFGLIIKNLTEEDVHRTYSCSNGFDLFKKNLTLDESYEYHPKNDTVDMKINVNGSLLHFVVQFKKVYPIPSCQAFLDEEDLSHKLTMNKTKVGLVYSVTIELIYELKTQSGTLKLPCTIGTKKTTFVEQDLTFTYDEDHQTMDFIPIYVIAGVAGVIGVCAIIVTAVTLVLYKCRPSICIKKHEYYERNIRTATFGTTTRSDKSVVSKIEQCKPFLDPEKDVKYIQNV